MFGLKELDIHRRLPYLEGKIFLLKNRSLPAIHEKEYKSSQAQQAKRRYLYYILTRDL
jgi:hypothetical protein